MMKAIPRRIWLVFWMTLGGILLVISAVAGYAYAYHGRMLPRTYIGGVSVGHLTEDAARQEVVDHEAAFLNGSLIISYTGGSISLAPNRLGLQFENETALAAAYRKGTNHSLLSRLKQLAIAPFHRSEYAVVLDPITDSGSNYLHTNLGPGVEQKAKETSIAFVPGDVTVVPGVAGHLIDIPALQLALVQAYQGGEKQITAKLVDFEPQVTAANAEAAADQAQSLLGASFQVQVGTQTISLTPQIVSRLLTTSVIPEAADVPAHLALTTQTSALQAVISGWAQQFDHSATNALLGITNGLVGVIQPDSDGITLDQAATLPVVQAALTSPNQSRVITAPTTVVKAAVRADTLAAAGITQLIGTATTDYVGSPANRVFNITLGQKSLNGILVADGSQFSTLDNLGPIDQAHGYKPELSIINNRTVPEDGGGLCQVSTTLFRSVLNAGLPVTERVNHSYRVGYYEAGVGPGLDATIYSPAPDFKWKNDTGHAVYVQSHIIGTKLTFELYGTSDGRTSQISAPDIISQTPPGDPIYSNTATLPKGTTQQIEHPHPGAVTVVTYTVMRGGQTVATQTFKSTYKPWPAQFLVGTS